MTDFLGAPLNVIAIVLVALVGLIVGVCAYLWYRHRVIFSIGLRNIGRRPARSVLIVLGLMLSTVIICAALATGDTVSYSITNDAYAKLGHVDELIQVRTSRPTASLTDEQILPPGLVQQDAIDSIGSEFKDSDQVDGILPGLRFPAPVRVPAEETTEARVVIIGLESGKMAGFEDDVRTDKGDPYDISDLKFDEGVANESAADRLGLKIGERADIYVGGLPRSINIVGIVKDSFLTGWTRKAPAGILVSKQTIQFLFGVITPAKGAGFVAISNTGGVRDSVGPSEQVQREARVTLRSSRYDVTTIKKDYVDRARELGSNMAAIFVVLGLFSIAAGLLLIFLILITLASERRMEMGMSRAVGMKRSQLVEGFMAEGLAYSLTSAALGAALGVAVSIGMTYAMRYIFQRFDVAIAFHVTPQSLIIAYCAGVVLTFLTVTVSAWRVSRLSVVAAIREVDEPPPRATGMRSLVLGIIMMAFGALLTGLGIVDGSAWAFGSGVSLILIGAAFAARAAGAPERPVFSATSLAVILLWVLLAGGNLNSITGTLDAGLETFFIGGILMVAAATFLIVHNAELLLGTLRVVGFVFARAVPAVVTAVAYPLANKTRTGMTIAMLSLVVFALVMISTMSLNFRELFLNPDARGGWDVQVQVLTANGFSQDANGNKFGPLGEALDRKFYDTTQIEDIAAVGLANDRNTQIAEIDSAGQAGKPGPFRLLGTDSTFLQQNKISLQARAEGIADDRAAWDAVLADPNNAIIDGTVVPGINYGNITQSRFILNNFESGTTTFKPFDVEVSNTASGATIKLHIVGIMSRGPSETYTGLWASRQTLGDAFPITETQYFMRMKPGVNVQAEANTIEETLAENGVSAHSIQRDIEDQQTLNIAFFYLVQGFMALGLTVGLAALGVIAFRTVVERRQQIGLMRAIGFSRSNVALSFVLESAFVAILGIANGIWPALLLANRLLSSDEFSSAGFTTFYVPWMQITLMAVLVFLASVLTTIIPSRQASNIPPAAALRYE